MKSEKLITLIHSHLGEIDPNKLSSQDYINSKIVSTIESLCKSNSPHSIAVGDAYNNYKTKTEIMMGHGFHGKLLSHGEFIELIKTDDEFAKTWVSQIYESITDVMKQLKEDYGITEGGLIGKIIQLDIGSSSPVTVKIKEITKDSVICEYIYSSDGRIEKFDISSFELFSHMKIN